MTEFTGTENPIMPKTNAPKMEDIKFGVPQPLLQDALELAESEGWKAADFHRMVWEKGLAVHAEGSNKRLVNRRLRSRRDNEADTQDPEK